MLSSMLSTISSISHWPSEAERTTSSTALPGHPMPINTFHRSETTNKLWPQRQAGVPPPVTSSYITPPVVKCNHIFRKSSFSAREKRLYQIHTHCHYPAQVVSAHYLLPLKFSQHAIDSMKITGQLQWCVLRFLQPFYHHKLYLLLCPWGAELEMLFLYLQS